MKRSLGIIIALILGFIAGIALAIYIHNIANNLPQYSPDRVVKIILERGTIVGANSKELPLTKGMVVTVFEGDGRKYFRWIIESPRYALLITIEDERVIEAEIWDRTEGKSVFYEIDADAMGRYGKNYRTRQPAELESGKKPATRSNSK